MRKRREDIEPLAQVVLARVGARHGRALRFSPDTLRLLLEHDWPGNVREMENALEYAVTVCRGQTVLPEDLPELDAGSVSHATDAGRTPGPRVARPDVEPAEVERLRQALEAHRWRRGDAARALGISRITLWRRMQATGLLRQEP